MLEAGFKSSRKFTKRLHLWDILERVSEQLAVDETNRALRDGSSSSSSYREGRVHSPDSEPDYKDLFQKAVSRINSNNPSIGKDEKVLKWA